MNFHFVDELEEMRFWNSVGCLWAEQVFTYMYT